MFGDLNNKSGSTHFANKVIELTETFTPKEKDLLLKNIEIFKDFKNNAK